MGTVRCLPSCYQATDNEWLGSHVTVSMIGWLTNVEQLDWELAGETEVLKRKPVPVPLSIKNSTRPFIEPGPPHWEAMTDLWQVMAVAAWHVSTHRSFPFIFTADIRGKPDYWNVKSEVTQPFPEWPLNYKSLDPQYQQLDWVHIHLGADKYMVRYKR
jgi:hypothetical protein